MEYYTQISHPFICLWTPRLLPCPGYYKQCCNEHWGAHVSFRSGFIDVYAQQWDCWVTSSVQFSSVAQSCPTLCDPMNHSTPGLPVHHQLPEFSQTHVHRVSDTTQLSHPLSSPSPPAPNPSQHQGFSNKLTLRMRWLINLKNKDKPKARN